MTVFEDIPRIPESFDLVEWQRVARDNSNNGQFLYQMFDRACTLSGRGMITENERLEVCSHLSELLSQLTAIKNSVDS